MRPQLHKIKFVCTSRTSVILLHTLIYSIFFFQISFAETLEVKTEYLKSLFDYTNPYRGQTFMLPAEVKADKLTVYVSSNIFQSFTFNLLLTEIDTANGFHPTTVLFESKPLYIPIGGKNTPIPYTVDLGGIPLTGGKLYAFILDVFVSLSQINSDTIWQYSTQTGMNIGATYPFGHHFYLQKTCTNKVDQLPCGNRENHFADSWVVDTSEDMGFILEYIPVPSPAPVSVSHWIELLLLRDNANPP